MNSYLIDANGNVLTHVPEHHGLTILIAVAIWFLLACVCGIALGKWMKRLDGL